MLIYNKPGLFDLEFFPSHGICYPAGSVASTRESGVLAGSGGDGNTGTNTLAKCCNSGTAVTCPCSTGTGAG